jgi:hypothetical protein
MSHSFIKKIVSVPEFQQLCLDIAELYNFDNNEYGHSLGLKHDAKLIRTSGSHESLLLWNAHIWAHFNGEKWDSVFAGIVRKSEKFGKKVMEEYLWLSKTTNVGFNLYKNAIDYARSQNCEFIFMSVVENHPLSSKVKSLYKKMGYQKDTETYIKKL